MVILNNDIIIKSILCFFIGIIALMISYRSYRAYKISKSYTLGYFSLAFLSLSMGFFLNLFSTFILGLHAVNIPGTLTFHCYTAALMLFRFFSMLGFILLFFATQNIGCDFLSQLIIYFFMTLIIFSVMIPIVYILLSIFLLILIAHHYLNHAVKLNNIYTLFIFISIILLLLSQLTYLFICHNASFIQEFIYLISFMLMYYVIFKITN